MAMQEREHKKIWANGVLTNLLCLLRPLVFQNKPPTTFHVRSSSTQTTNHSKPQKPCKILCRPEIKENETTDQKSNLKLTQILHKTYSKWVSLKVGNFSEPLLIAVVGIEDYVRRPCPAMSKAGLRLQPALVWALANQLQKAHWKKNAKEKNVEKWTKRTCDCALPGMENFTVATFKIQYSY